jgi:two-component system KDP operon response regulator KdpE
MHQLLVVEDQLEIRAILRTALSAAGYRVIEADTAARAIVEARSHKPDLAIIDLGLPDSDGVTVIRDIRSWSVMPLLVLSARSAEAEKVVALDAGADDYVTKPFGMDELLARVRVGLRRAPTDGLHKPVLHFGGITVDLDRREAHRGAGEVLHLTPLEFRLLEALARRVGLIVPQRQLLREVWGPGKDGDARSLRVYIKSLRDKLEPEPVVPRYIQTEIGVGYRLNDSVLAADAPPADS